MNSAYGIRCESNLTQRAFPLGLQAGIDELRALVPRESADVFETQRDAYDAISKMPNVFGGMGYIFAAEVAD